MFPGVPMLSMGIATEGLLRKLGYASDYAYDGEDALPKVRSGDYDIVFMDCQMPRMDGFTAARSIKAMPLEHPPCVIALSASATAEEQHKCREAGMSYFVAKPVRLEMLADVLRKVAIDLGLQVVPRTNESRPKQPLQPGAGKMPRPCY
jgi:CheY-like chemotaxis protein